MGIFQDSQGDICTGMRAAEGAEPLVEHENLEFAFPTAKIAKGALRP